MKSALRCFATSFADGRTKSLTSSSIISHSLLPCSPHLVRAFASSTTAVSRCWWALEWEPLELLELLEQDLLELEHDLLELEL